MGVACGKDYDIVQSIVQLGGVKAIIEEGTGDFDAMMKKGASVVERGFQFKDLYTRNAFRTGMVLVAVLLVIQIPDPSGNMHHSLTIPPTCAKIIFCLMVFLATIAYFLHSSIRKKNLAVTRLVCPTRVVVVGNQGSGKYNLLNELLGRAPFQSRTSFHDTMTKRGKLVRDSNGNTFVDTPGLSDFDTREEAAKEITRAIRTNISTREMKLVFVVMLWRGRARGIDIATMKLVLDALPSNTPYGIIVNKVGCNNVRKLHHLTVTLNQGRENTTSFIHFIENNRNLTGIRSAVSSKNDETITFLNLLPFCDAVRNEDVKNVFTREMDHLHLEMNERLYQLQHDKEELRRQMKKMEKVCAEHECLNEKINNEMAEDPAPQNSGAPNNERRRARIHKKVLPWSRCK